jgi:hypothetical protein
MIPTLQRENGDQRAQTRRNHPIYKGNPMIIIKNREQQQVHNRKIDIVTYEYDETAVVVEGRLTDNRFRKTYYLSGDSRPPGIVHDMIIRIIVRGPDMTIEDIDVEMVEVPRDVCRETQYSLEPVKGIKIKAGFTEKVKALVGGPKGCTHLVALLLAMAPAAVQGAWTAVAQQPIDPTNFSGKALEFLENTCWIWRSDGDLMKETRVKLTAKK